MIGAALATSALALAVVALVTPAALWTAWAAGGARSASGSLRLLGAMPLAAVAPAVAGSHSHAWLVLRALGAYAPVTLGLLDLRAGLDRRQLDAALALGLSPLQALRHVVLPVTVRPLLATTLRVPARLVGEAGLFVVVGNAPALGAAAWRSRPGSVVALLVVAIGWALVAERIDAHAPMPA